MKKSLLAAAVAGLFAVAPASAATTFVVDANHSDVSFQIRHLVSKVRGQFREFSGTIVRDEADPAKSSVEFRIAAASIDTRNESRDNDLRSEEFFDVAKYPEITFKSTAVEKVSDGEYRVTGDLAMHGVTKAITLRVAYTGEMKDPRGATRAGFALETTLDRKQFGINWNRALDNGGYLLSDEVEVEITLEVKAQ